MLEPNTCPGGRAVPRVGVTNILTCPCGGGEGLVWILNFWEQASNDDPCKMAVIGRVEHFPHSFGRGLVGRGGCVEHRMTEEDLLWG